MLQNGPKFWLFSGPGFGPVMLIPIGSTLSVCILHYQVCCKLHILVSSHLLWIAARPGCFGPAASQAQGIRLLHDAASLAAAAAAQLAVAAVGAATLASAAGGPPPSSEPRWPYGLFLIGKYENEHPAENRKSYHFYIHGANHLKLWIPWEKYTSCVHRLGPRLRTTSLARIICLQRAWNIGKNGVMRMKVELAVKFSKWMTSHLSTPQCPT